MMGEQEPFVAHVNHEWEQVGRGVYCQTCNVLLYHGRVPPVGVQRAELMAWLDVVAAKARAQSKDADGADHQGEDNPGD